MSQEEDIQRIEAFALLKKIPFFSCSKKEYNLPKLANRYIASRYVIFDLSMIYPCLYFIFYDSSTGSSYRCWGNTFCGLFMEIKDIDANITITERDWTDIFSLKERVLTGDPLIDNQITINTNHNPNNHILLSEFKLRQLTQLMEVLKPFQMEVEVNAWNIVPELEQKTVVSLTVNRWLTNEEDIHFLITEGSKYFFE